MAPLPAFVEPMLCKLGRQAFDSDEHLFEIKWDGLRALTFTEASGYRLIGRRKTDFTPRYPELELLGSLPDGTLLDGELVCLRDGVPSFRDVMSREQARGEHRIRTLMGSLPCMYVAFDILYAGHVSVEREPLIERRKRLEELVQDCGDPRLVLCEGIVGEGKRLYEEVQRLALEGMVAKLLDSPYKAGRRTDAWTKVKPRLHLHCVVLGYVVEENDLRALHIAADFDGELEYVGRVGSGLTDAMRANLLTRLADHERAEPLVPGPQEGTFVEPVLFCTVSYLERNENGGLRAPVFVGLSE